MKTKLIALMVSLSLTALPARATGAVSLVGTIINGTAGAAIPADLEVSAAQLTSAGSETGRLSTRSAADGSFRIDGFDGNGSHYIVAATYEQVTYSVVIDADGSDESRVELKIFETTSDDSVITIESDSVTIIQGRNDAFEVLQLMRVRNSSDRTYVGRAKDDTPAVVNLPVALAGFDVSAGEGITADRVSTYADGVAAGDPLQPGATNFSYSYKLRAPRGGLAFQRAVSYPTAHVDVLIGPGLELRSVILTFREQRDFGGKTFRRFRGEAFDPGALLEADIAHASRASLGLWVGLGSIGVLALAAMIFGIRRRLSTKTSAPNRQALVDKIAVLDETFAAGGLSEDEHKHRRQDLKAQLVKLSEL